MLVPLTARSESFVVFSPLGERHVIRTTPNVRIVLSVVFPKANRADVVTSTFLEGQIVAARAFVFHVDKIIYKSFCSGMDRVGDLTRKGQNISI